MTQIKTPRQNSSQARNRLQPCPLSWVITATLATAAAQASAETEQGFAVEVGFGAHAGLSSVDYSDSTAPNPNKEEIYGSLPYYYTATTTLDPIYNFLSDRHGQFQLKLHSAIQLDDSWLDDDQIDELSIEFKSDRYGNFDLGEDDGTADRMKPKQSSRVGIAVGHSAFTGITPWWGNLPFAGGTIREGSDPYDWD